LPHYHAVVWIDHREARVIHFNADDADEKTVHPDHPSHHLHHKAGSPSGTHDKGEPSFYHDVANALAEAREFLVVGPSTAKTEFVTWLHGHSPALAGRLFGVEPLQHMSDGQVVAEARRFFKKADRIRPPAP
jgi:stalled ribosome rescue protein Dom34